jgi:hypothetical protein
MSFKTVAMPPQMKQNRPNSPGPEREAPAQQPQRPKVRKPGQVPLWLRIVISLLVIWHLAALFLAPLSIQPSSPMVVEITQGSFMQWYLDALYLNHGYHFFAPDPGMGHLIRYEVFDDRGSVIEQGEFPNKNENWPRLLYHRYFMLADQADVAAGSAGSEAEANQWVRNYLQAYARQILQEHDGAAAVRVRRVVHAPVSLQEALQGKRLDDPSLYRTEQEVLERRQGAGMPALNQGGAWNHQWRQDIARGWQGGVR